MFKFLFNVLLQQLLLNDVATSSLSVNLSCSIAFYVH